jgi:hypothetical protein
LHENYIDITIIVIRQRSGGMYARHREGEQEKPGRELRRYI